MRFRFVAALTVLVSAQAFAQTNVDKVWVNFASKVYHCPGTRYYGATKQGQYMTEAEALQRGNRPANGERCNTQSSTANGVSVQLLGGTAVPQATSMTLYGASEIVWKDGPAAFPPGTQMAVLEGDPSLAGTFTIRIRFPDAFIVNPHWHSQTEHATVISGVLHIGMGDRFNRDSTRTLTAGSFGYWPAGMRHFAWFEGETVLQVHGQGPWTITFVNPADDRRNR